jgi:hypothetical protein
MASRDNVYLYRLVHIIYTYIIILEISNSTGIWRRAIYLIIYSVMAVHQQSSVRSSHLYILLYSFILYFHSLRNTIISCYWPLPDILHSWHPENVIRRYYDDGTVKDRLKYTVYNFIFYASSSSFVLPSGRCLSLSLSLSLVSYYIEF